MSIGRESPGEALPNLYSTAHPCQPNLACGARFQLRTVARLSTSASGPYDLRQVQGARAGGALPAKGACIGQSGNGFSMPLSAQDLPLALDQTLPSLPPSSPAGLGLHLSVVLERDGVQNALPRPRMTSRRPRSSCQLTDLRSAQFWNRTGALDSQEALCRTLEWRQSRERIEGTAEKPTKKDPV